MMRGHSTAQTPLNFGVTWVGEALSTIRAYRDALNSLNAFPVPDRDTGSNLTYTLQALNESFTRGFTELLHDLNEYETDIQTINRRLGELYESALVHTSRTARGNSGTLLCAWALEAVRAYWNLPGHLAEELGESIKTVPLIQNLEVAYRETPVAESDTHESAYREAYALSLAAERVRRIVADDALEHSTMVAVMIELADYRFHYRMGAEHADLMERAEFRRDSMRRALEGTAQNPPKPDLKGFVDAGALGFYLAVVQSNPRWMSSRMSAEEIFVLAQPPTRVTEPAADLSARKNTLVHGEHHTNSSEVHKLAGDSEPAWELMGTLTAEPVALAQLRGELERLGDSLLLTPLDLKNNVWALHVHVSSVDDARKIIALYGVLDDERVSSLIARDGDSSGVSSCSQNTRE